MQAAEKRSERHLGDFVGESERRRQWEVAGTGELEIGSSIAGVLPGRICTDHGNSRRKAARAPSLFCINPPPTPPHAPPTSNMDPEPAKPETKPQEPAQPAMDPKPIDSAPVDAAAGDADKKQWRDKGVRGNKRKWQQHGSSGPLQHGSRDKRKDIGRGEYMYAPTPRPSTPQLINSKPQSTRQACPKRGRESQAPSSRGRGS